MPGIMAKEIEKMGGEYGYVGRSGGGGGYTNGVSNVYYVFMVSIPCPEDATVFKIHFPECKIYVSEN